MLQYVDVCTTAVQTAIVAVLKLGMKLHGHKWLTC